MKLKNVISISLIAVFMMSVVVTPAFALRKNRPANRKHAAEMEKYGPCENKPDLVKGVLSAADWLVTGTFSMVGVTFDKTEDTAKNAMTRSGETVNSAIDTSGAIIDGTLNKSGEIVDGTLNKSGEIVDGTLKKSGEIVDDTMKLGDNAIKGTTGIIMNP